MLCIKYECTKKMKKIQKKKQILNIVQLKSVTV